MSFHFFLEEEMWFHFPPHILSQSCPFLIHDLSPT